MIVWRGALPVLFAYFREWPMRISVRSMSALSAMLAPALMLAAPLPAAAQSADEPAVDDDQPMAEMTEKLADPENQQQMAMMMRAMGEILLDMPVAPMMNAMRDMGGEDMPEVAPDTTLRSVAPEAGRLPEEIERNVPRAMQAMSKMAGAMEVMMPALRDMAQQMKDRLPRDY